MNHLESYFVRALVVFLFVLFFLTGISVISSEAKVVNAEIDHIYDYTYPDKTGSIEYKIERSILDMYSEIPENRLHKLSSQLNHWGKRLNLDPFLAVSVIRKESSVRNVKSEIRHRVGVVSRDVIVEENACGYFQIKPATFESVMGYNTTCRRIIYDVDEQIEAGMKHLAGLVHAHGANGLGSWNAGPGLGKRNWGYILKIVREYKHIRNNFKD